MIVLKIFRFMFVGLFLIALALFLLAHTPSVQKKAMTALKSAVFDATGIHVEVKGISFDFPRSIAIKGISLRQADAEIPWIEADKVVVKVDLKALWEGRIEPVALTVYQGELHGLPKISAETPPLPPFLITINSLKIDPALVGGTPHIIAKGKLRLDLNGTPLLSGAIDLTADQGNAAVNFVLMQDKTLTGSYNVKMKDAEMFGDLHLSPELVATGHLQAAAAVQGKSVSGTTDYTWNGQGPVQLTALHLDAAGIILDGELQVYPEEQWAEGSLEGTLDDLGQLEFENMPEIKGKIAVAAHLYRGTTPLLEITIESPRLIKEDITAKNITLNATITDIFTHPMADIHVTTAKIHNEALTYHGVDIRTTIDPASDKWPFSLGTSKDKLRSEGTWSWKDGIAYADLQKLQGKLAHVAFSLLEPMSISFQDGSLAFSPVALGANVGSGSINAFLSYDGYALSGTTRLENLIVEELLPTGAHFPIHGTLSGLITLEGPLAKPMATLDLHAAGLKYEDLTRKELPPASSEIQAKIADGHFSCTGTIAAPEHPPIYFNCLLPVAFSLSPPDFHFDKQEPIAGNIAAGGEITPLLQLLFGNSVPFSGNASATLAVTGTLESPELSGACDLTNGFYEIPEIGVLLYGVTAHIEAQGPIVKVTNVSGNDGRGGAVIGEGFAELDASKNFPFRLNLQLQEALLLNQDYVHAICSGPIAFFGDSKAGWLQGQLVVNTGNVLIPERPDAVINSVDVIYTNIPKNAPPPQPMSVKRSDWILHLDIGLDIPENLSITGTDLKSIWKGALAIQGTNQQPAIIGEIRSVEGEYLFNGNPFEITKGTVTFAGDLDKKSSMYVIVTKDLDQVKVDVIAKGPLKNPEITFRSNPPMPQREILSWILFNRGTNEISPFQGTQLSESITNLKSQQKGPDVLTKIRSTFGIDRFEISRNPNSDSDTEVNVQVGKYVTDNVLVSVIKSDVNSLAVEAALSNRVKLQAQVGDDAQGKLILKWKRSY